MSNRAQNTSALLLALMVAAGGATAEEVHLTTIANVRSRPNVVYVRFASCTYYARIFLNSEYDKAMLALALSAAAAGTRVEVNLASSCHSTEPLINYMDAVYQ